jgi:16S rRNA (adenine1518-N6/adenine1519-N6)-dimethyltransferase
MSLLEQTKQLLRTHRISPNKLLGQNFTVEPSVLERVVGCASLTKYDVVLDVGAGFGFLTRLIASECRRVVAVEADDTVAHVLRGQLGNLGNVEIVAGNVLKVDIPSFDKVASVPPYQISSKLLLWLFNRSFDKGVLVFQKEFVKHLMASVGSDEYGWLTVLTYYHAETEVLDEVSKEAFYPEPQVDSSIIRLAPRKRKPFTVNNEGQFLKFAQALFTNRNRKVRNSVLPFLKGVLGMDAEEARRLAEAAPYHDKRARELAPEDIGELANAIIN